MISYRQKLKSPQWQKVRLQILNRDNFQCCDCGSTTEQLHVHHTYYEYNKDPWDYPLESLKTLCWECHEVETEMKKEITQIIKNLLVSGYSSFEIHSYLEALLRPLTINVSKKDIISCATFALGNEDVVLMLQKKQIAICKEFINMENGAI